MNKAKEMRKLARSYSVSKFIKSYNDLLNIIEVRAKLGYSYLVLHARIKKQMVSKLEEDGFTVISYDRKYLDIEW